MTTLAIWTYLACLQKFDVVLPNLRAILLLANVVEGEFERLADGVSRVRPRIHSSRFLRSEHVWLRAWVELTEHMRGNISTVLQKENS